MPRQGRTKVRLESYIVQKKEEEYIYFSKIYKACARKITIIAIRL